MEENPTGNCEETGSRLPLPALRLLVAPMRLLSAAVWQTIRHKAVARYGMVEEFVSTVTDILPELLTSHQRAELILGLRARFILELCQFESPEVVHPHLDRMDSLIRAWVMEAGATNVNSDFVDIVKHMLKDPEKRENFFRTVFPKEFGPTFDEDIHNLTWLLLSRLETFFPLQTFQQVASMCADVSSVLGDCMERVSQCEELRVVLRCPTNLSPLDHNEGALDGACIISALKLPWVERPGTRRKEAQDPKVSSCEKELLPLSPHTPQMDTEAEYHTLVIKSEESAENGPGVDFGDVGGQEEEESVGLLQSGPQDAYGLLKRCHVQLERLDAPPSSSSRPLRPVRRNRGLKLKQILLLEKRGLGETAKAKPASRRANPPGGGPGLVSDKVEESSIFRRNPSDMAPVSSCSEADSWSYYSDHGSYRSPSLVDSWSEYSEAASAASGPSDCDGWSGGSDEDAPGAGPQILSAGGRTPGKKKKIHQVYCFICKEQVNASLRAHMVSHFPQGDFACPRCDSRFKLYSSFRTHLSKTCFDFGQQRVDPEKPDQAGNLYQCDRCQEAFRYKVSLERHKLTHHEWYCAVCRRVLRDAAALVRHKASHTAFQCTRCQEAFTLFLPLLRHCQNVHNMTSRPLKCNHCPKTLPKLRLLILHEWKHTGHLPFQCAQCGCRFRCDADLLYHERVHTRERPFLCPECGKTFSQNSNLLRHLNLLHGELRHEKRHQCCQCEKSFKEKGALKKHQRSKHLHELFRHPCPFCGKVVSATSLARHKLIHTGEKPFKCSVPECDKNFRSTSEVKKHVLRQHTTERPYKCEVCGKGFIKMGFLNTHAKIHSGEKPFVCQICGKAFPKLYSMQRHKKLLHQILRLQVSKSGDQ